MIWIKCVSTALNRDSIYIILCIIFLQGREPRPTSERKPESDAIHLFLNEEQGYYEIGPQLEEDNNIFVLSVTIGLASNLAKVNLFDLNSSSILFWFLSSHIINDFKDLVKFFKGSLQAVSFECFMEVERFSVGILISITDCMLQFSKIGPLEEVLLMLSYMYMYMSLMGGVS